MMLQNCIIDELNEIKMNKCSFSLSKSNQSVYLNQVSFIGFANIYK